MQPWIDVGGGVRVTGHGMAWIPSEHALVVADVHLGYELAARRRGGYLPALQSGATVGQRLVQLARACDATTLVIAGDLRHSTRDVDDIERREVAALADVVRREVALITVRGNHDAGEALIGQGLSVVTLGPVDVVHAPPPSLPARLTVCGHLHPRVTLRDETDAGGRYPCALVCASIVVLPAFSEWAGGVEASRLVRSLPRARWRALPMVNGLVADVGVEFEPREPG